LLLWLVVVVAVAVVAAVVVVAVACYHCCPASYRKPMQQLARRVAIEAGARGVRGLISVDFLARWLGGSGSVAGSGSGSGSVAGGVPGSGSGGGGGGGGGAWSLAALEINVRPGGTTHPLCTLALAVDGAYRGSDGTYRDRNGVERV
jgi:hypothetical protein